MVSIPALDRIRERYGQLEAREQSALITLATFGLLLFLYFLIWNPINQYHASSGVERDRQLSLLQYLRATEKEARTSSKGVTQAPAGQSLLTTVSRVAQQMGIKPNRLQPEGSDAVSVWFEGVAFDDLMRMLKQVRARQGIVVRQISIDREELPGMVRARIVLRS
jgi:general secretion pathway protein M